MDLDNSTTFVTSTQAIDKIPQPLVRDLKKGLEHRTFVETFDSVTFADNASLIKLLKWKIWSI